ncbi:hypothetical protein [Paenibacillus sp.]|uniref:hypothetical protein n=1 Tax=Paenibacillus sp. TaxID=58172 RepID=UPI002D3A747D|nr:hypothetical protein [Paenibacillus sp.]HZG88427.1 hypothetical protein [Paenibacillus sp.]
MESLRRWTPPLMCIASMTLLVAQTYGYVAMRWYVPNGGARSRGRPPGCSARRSMS